MEDWRRVTGVWELWLMCISPVSPPFACSRTRTSVYLASNSNVGELVDRVPHVSEAHLRVHFLNVDVSRVCAGKGSISASARCPDRRPSVLQFRPATH